MFDVRCLMFDCNPSPQLYLGCRPQHSTATSRRYRPCRGSQPLHSLPLGKGEADLRANAPLRGTCMLGLLSSSNEERTKVRSRLRTKLIAEGNVHVTRGLHQLAIGRNQLETIDRFGDRHVAYLIILVTDHRAEVTFVCQLHGFYAETRGENSVQRRRRATALEMAEHTAPRFLAGAFGNFPRHHVANPTKPKLACLNVALHLFAVS